MHVLVEQSTSTGTGKEVEGGGGVEAVCCVDVIYPSLSFRPDRPRGAQSVVEILASGKVPSNKSKVSRLVGVGTGT